MSYTARLSAPDASDKRWINTSYGGYNKCIVRDSAGSVLPNCTGYVHGRWMEIAGRTSETSLSLGNANTYYNKSDGYSRSSTPSLGAVACYTGSLGHVAIVEEISSDGNSITLSESNYSGARFNVRTVTKSNGWNIPGSIVSFQGFIVNPWVDTSGGTEPPPSPEPDPGTGEDTKNKKIWIYAKYKIRRKKL